jgi:hypothetical protein
MQPMLPLSWYMQIQPLQPLLLEVVKIQGQKPRMRQGIYALRESN